VALEWMRDHWTLSVFRAAMGIEPTGAYLSHPDYAQNQLTTLVQNAIAAGVYVIIDWHAHNATHPAHTEAACSAPSSQRKLSFSSIPTARRCPRRPLLRSRN